MSGDEDPNYDKIEHKIMNDNPWININEETLVDEGVPTESTNSEVKVEEEASDDSRPHPPISVDVAVDAEKPPSSLADGNASAKDNMGGEGGSVNDSVQTDSDPVEEGHIIIAAPDTAEDITPSSESEVVLETDAANDRPPPSDEATEKPPSVEDSTANEESEAINNTSSGNESVSSTSVESPSTNAESLGEDVSAVGTKLGGEGTDVEESVQAREEETTGNVGNLSSIAGGDLCSGTGEELHTEGSLAEKQDELHLATKADDSKPPVPKENEGEGEGDTGEETAKPAEGSLAEKQDELHLATKADTKTPVPKENEGVHDASGETTKSATSTKQTVHAEPEQVEAKSTLEGDIASNALKPGDDEQSKNASLQADLLRKEQLKKMQEAERLMKEVEQLQKAEEEIKRRHKLHKEEEERKRSQALQLKQEPEQKTLPTDPREAKGRESTPLIASSPGGNVKTPRAKSTQPSSSLSEDATDYFSRPSGSTMKRRGAQSSQSKIVSTDDDVENQIGRSSPTQRGIDSESSGGRSWAKRAPGSRGLIKILLRKIGLAFFANIDNETLEREGTDGIFIAILFLKETLMGFLIALFLGVLITLLDHQFLLRLSIARNFRKATFSVLNDNETLYKFEENADVTLMSMDEYEAAQKEIVDASVFSNKLEGIISKKEEQREDLEKRYLSITDEFEQLFTKLGLDQFSDTGKWSEPQKISCIRRVFMLQEEYKVHKLKSMLSAMEKDGCKKTKEEIENDRQLKEKEDDLLKDWDENKKDWCGDCEYDAGSESCSERAQWFNFLYGVSMDRAMARAMTRSEKCTLSYIKIEEEKVANFCKTCVWGNKQTCQGRVDYLVYTYKVTERAATIETLKRPSCLQSKQDSK